MVWAFGAGILVGFPAGCYLREHGYLRKMRNAYSALRPDADYLPTNNLDKLLPNQKREKFFMDLKKGMANKEDFERYIYGGNYDRKFFTDERDKLEDKARDQLREWEDDAKFQVERAKFDADRESQGKRND